VPLSQESGIQLGVIPALRQAQDKPGFARAGIQRITADLWIPAFAGMTTKD
jgi:hypothetical protein